MAFQAVMLEIVLLSQILERLSIWLINMPDNIREHLIILGDL